MSKAEPSKVEDPLFEVLRSAADMLRARGWPGPGARLRLTPDATGVRLEVFAPPVPEGEPGALDR
ncbi:MAG TPA: hypothetical protein VFS43_00225 [Polyangiaceae bacterium]|nr:hypothetical protein [Polyangiaceae bacterium]